jgi:lipooligosaccharide transport system permease protein
MVSTGSTGERGGSTGERGGSPGERGGSPTEGGGSTTERGSSTTERGGSTTEGGGSTGAVTRDERRLTVRQGMTRQFDYHWTVYKRTWKSSVVTSFLSPLLYVLAALKWHKSFYAQIASPLEPRDLADGMLMFTLFRVGSTCGVYFLVMAPFGVFATWWGPILAWLTTMLVGMAFAVWTFAFSAHIHNPESFGLIFRLGLIPLFLFSGSFFPVSNLGGVLEWVAKATPLWHGVNLARMLCLDHVDGVTALVNTAVLVVVLVPGWWLAVRTLTRRLET